MAIDEAGHDDRQTTATVADRLFATLETTTRWASLDGRDVLLTDTVGLLDDATLERRIDTLATAGPAESIRAE
jgi:GTP-binding protein HflX